MKEGQKDSEKYRSVLNGSSYKAHTGTERSKKENSTKKRISAKKLAFQVGSLHSIFVPQCFLMFSPNRYKSTVPDAKSVKAKQSNPFRVSPPIKREMNTLRDFLKHCRE